MKSHANPKILLFKHLTHQKRFQSMIIFGTKSINRGTHMFVNVCFVLFSFVFVCLFPCRYHIMDEMPAESISQEDLAGILQHEDHTYGEEKEVRTLFSAADSDKNDEVTFEEMLRVDGKLIFDTLGSDDPATMAHRGLEVRTTSPSQEHEDGVGDGHDSSARDGEEHGDEAKDISGKRQISDEL